MADEGPTSESVNDLAKDAEQALIEEFSYLYADEELRPPGAPPIRTEEELWNRIHSLGDRRPTALCLSGGGIRSATFGLGVLQGLAQSGRLSSFTYLSSVSGGGYIASCLSYWLMIEKWVWSRVFIKLRADDHQSTTQAPITPQGVGATGAMPISASENDPIARLRASSNYLSPVWGLSGDALSLVATFLRNLLLNWCVTLPLLALVVLLPRLHIALLGAALENSSVNVAKILLGLSAILLIVGVAYIVADLPGGPEEPEPRWSSVWPRRRPIAAGTSPAPVSRPPKVPNQFALYCFAPVVAAVILFSYLCYDLKPEIPLWQLIVAGFVTHALGILAGTAWRYLRGLDPRRGRRDHVGFTLLLATGTLGAVLIPFTVRYAGSAFDFGNDQSRLLYATVSVPALLACFWATMALYAGVASRQTTEFDREWWSRASAWWLYAAVIWLMAFGLVVYLPVWLFNRLDATLPAWAQLSTGAAGLGILTSLIGYWSKNGTDLKRRAATLVSTTGLRLLDLVSGAAIVAILLWLSLLCSNLVESCSAHGWPGCTAAMHEENAHLRYEAVLYNSSGGADGKAAVQHSGEAPVYLHVLTSTGSLVLCAALFALGGFSLLLSSLIGANTFSLHGMYGNRLVRSYLGAARARRHPHWFTGFDENDNCPLAKLDQKHIGKADRRLFPVINMTLNLVQPSASRLAWQQRKAASFIATPLRCGSVLTRYAPTGLYGGQHGMSLGRAMTISGAAASPNMGYHSSALVTFVMALFNVRLGWWLPNPGNKWRKRWTRNEPAVGVVAMRDEALGRTTDDRSSVYVSDGGHFENLGMYEMVRRRCHRIVVVDATSDPDFSYPDLLSAVRKIRVDLGITIVLPATLPGPGRQTRHQRLVVGKICYSDRDGVNVDDGYLYLIKPILLGTEFPDITEYKQSSRRDGSVFPHQSSADQFFDETQFESYRMLGLLSARVLTPEKGDDDYDDAAPDWRKFIRSPLPAAGASPEPIASSAPSSSNSDTAGNGLVAAIQAYGIGITAAAALTVGGTLGVVGTLQMAPSEIRLASEDRALLVRGLQLHLATAGKVTPTTEPDRVGGASTDMREAAATLQKSLDTLILLFGNSDRALVIKTQTLNEAIALLAIKLDERANVGLNSKTEAQITALSKSMAEMSIKLDRLKRLPGGTPVPVQVTNLDDLKKTIGDVKAAVDEVTTAINSTPQIRGQDGGVR